MESITGFKYRLYPNKAQRKQFDRNIGCCRWVYNWALSMKRDAYEKEKVSLSIRKDISPRLPIMKKTEETAFLTEADANALICELNNLDTAYKNFFSRGGFPKFKKRVSSGSFTFQIPSKCFGTFNSGYIKIGKAGLVRVRVHKPLDVNAVKEYVTISRNTIGEYYISVKYGVDIPSEPSVKPTVNNTIGVDFGIKDLAITDDGTKYGKLQIDRKLLKKKRRLQRALSRKTVFSKNGKVVWNEQSENYKELQRKLAKIDVTIARQREYHQYEVTNSILDKDCLFVAVEDLNVKGMSSSGKRKRKKLTKEEYALLTEEEKMEYNRKKPKQFNKSMLEQSLGALKLKMKNKARKTGKKIIEIDRFYASSQTCSKCGYVNKKTKNLSVRSWTCPVCGAKHDRDVNAAVNIRNKAIESLRDSENRQLPGCTGKVMSPEAKLGDTKQNKKNRRMFQTSAPIEGENSSKLYVNILTNTNL